MLNVIRAGVWLAAASWIGLAIARGRFWDARADGLRAVDEDTARDAPDVHVVVPARNEADVIARTLGSLVAQVYAGSVAITCVDDRSTDATAVEARAVAEAAGAAERVAIVEGSPRPDGWAGKVWALAQGVASARARGRQPDYWWFSDADVEHDPDTLARLIATARLDRRDCVSQMVELHCGSTWERLLIPAFVYFFRMLYPFAWVNDDRRATAAAAGGCVLISDAMLQRIGGVERIRGALIDDCSLAAAVKTDGGTLWLGLATTSRSVRPYASLDEIWSMVARSAYTQLRYSPLLLAGTVAGMIVLYGVPPAAAIAGVALRRWDIAAGGLCGWLVMAATYAPTLRLYRVPRAAALGLPVAGALYTAMSVDSALRYARGSGGRWKGRDFTPSAS
jgi:hopene-associated glycosyltransferase HpnB